MKKAILSTALALLATAGASSEIPTDMDNRNNIVSAADLTLTTEWDKTFPASNDVAHCKVTFVNRYGITLAADLYAPLRADGLLPAIAVSGPFGAVKEQVSGLYARELARRGFLAIAFDPSYTGESGGTPRHVASPDINTEDFSAAVDYLTTRSDVDPGKIGILGICGWGGFAVNAAANDPRIKATVASTMYDMSRVSAKGYFDAATPEQRRELRHQLARQRTDDARNGYYAPGGGVVDPLPADAPQFVKDYYDYYKTPRGYHKRSLNSNSGFNATSPLPFLSFPLMAWASEIENAVMLVHGEKAHSLYFSNDTYSKLTEKWIPGTPNNKVLHIVPGASHTDLYDRVDIIPFDEIAAFYREYLK